MPPVRSTTLHCAWLGVGCCAVAGRRLTRPVPGCVWSWYAAAASGFLCDLDANTYDLTFLSFVMKDYQTKEVIFEISEDSPLPEIDFDEDTFTADQLRTIKYDFNADVLRKETVSTTCVWRGNAAPRCCMLGARRSHSWGVRVALQLGVF